MTNGDIEFVERGSPTLLLVDNVRRLLLSRRVSAPNDIGNQTVG
jgi:hypothetical protein